MAVNVQDSGMLPNAWVVDYGNQVGSTPAIAAQETGNQSLIPNMDKTPPSSAIPSWVIIVFLVIGLMILFGAM
jgi:hypothetical protein